MQTKHTPARIVMYDEDFDEAEANAQLIAAAPELYQVLVEVHEKCNQFGIALPASTTKRIELALAKARGENEQN